MTKITILGGTGYAGSALVQEAVERGFTTTTISRSKPEAPIEGATYLEGSVLDDTVRLAALADADVIIAALSPRGDMAGKVGPLYRELAVNAAASKSRLIIVGGFGSLRPAAGEPRIATGKDFSDDYRPEALELAGVLDWLQSDAPAGLDWLYVSPAASFGGFNPGQKTGAYRIAGEVPQYDADGNSSLSSQDLALALIDETEKPQHHSEHISVAY